MPVFPCRDETGVGHRRRDLRRSGVDQDQWGQGCQAGCGHAETKHFPRHRDTDTKRSHQISHCKGVQGIGGKMRRRRHRVYSFLWAWAADDGHRRR